MKFHATVLYVDDVAAAVDFYRTAFGLRAKHVDDALKYAELDTGETTLAIASHELGHSLTRGRYARSHDGTPSAVEISFLVPDVRSAFDTAVSAGAEPIADPELMPWGWTIAFVRAIEGTLIGICSAPV